MKNAFSIAFAAVMALAPVYASASKPLATHDRTLKVHDHSTHIHQHISQAHH